MSDTLSSIFAMPSSQLNPTVLVNYGLPSLDNTRGESYNNGARPRSPITQYGLVFDIDYSKHRYHVNFFTQNSGYDLFKWQLEHSYYSSKDDRIQAKRILDKFDEFELQGYDAYINFGRRNPSPGKKKPSLIPDYKIWAILVPNSDKEKGPFVHLHWGSLTYQILPDNWYKPRGRAFATCEWNCSLMEKDAING